MSEDFIRVAFCSDIKPGRMKRVDVSESDRRLLIVNIDGRFYAADDTCTHEDASLSKGALKGDLVRCPLHGSRFNLRTGEVLEEPAEENLRTYPVRVEGDEIWVDLADE